MMKVALFPLLLDHNYYIMLYFSSFSSKFFLTISFKASGGARNDIRCYVMDRANFINWENSRQAYAIYDSGKVTGVYDTIYLKG